MWTAIIEFLSSFKIYTIIYPDEAGVKTRCGRLKARLDTGIYWQWPIIDTIESASVVPQVIDLRPQNVTTKDKYSVMVSGAILYSIEDAYKALYKVQDYDTAISNYALTLIAKYTQGLCIDDINIVNMSIDLTDDLSTMADTWGLTVTDVTITDLARCKVLSLTGMPESE